MRVVGVEVKDLFDTFNHKIDFQKDSKITILHGPNGFGKTALLKLTYGILKREMFAIKKIPFSEFTMTFDDSTLLKVDKWVDSAKEEKNSAQMKMSYHGRALIPEEYSPEFEINEDIEFPLSIIEKVVPELERIAPRRWINKITSETLNLNQVLEQFSSLLPPMNFKGVPNWYKELTDSIPVFFIETQRLLSINRDERSFSRDEGKTTLVSSAEKYSKELLRKIQMKLSESATLSASLDRTFPIRLINKDYPKHLDENALTKKLDEIDKTRKRLMASGLLDEAPEASILSVKFLDATTKSVLWLFADDSEKKLSVFLDLAARIELMKNIINEHFLFKKVVTSKDKGFVFLTPAGKPLSPSDLSSGEQHELVLLYQLLFEVKDGSLILIDEPELSLHVAWQKAFLKDLNEVIKLVDVDFLIATHSPQIIRNRWDLTIELKGPEK